ncbi:DUF1304 domain-containing protein [Mycetocola spongiae]|nr:DUF1304 domain-containing protein [Mycetocola spongiae]UCR90456.1 DUF1304 domain-containing protein [Mycetocola spongiae]
MMILALVLAGLAAALHCYIFVLESVRWTAPATMKTFGVASAAEAETTRGLAFNQGFYNLFLAIAVFLGIGLLAAGNIAVGATLIFVGVGSMFAASLVLILSDGSKARAAITQGTLPLLTLIFLIIAL